MNRSHNCQTNRPLLVGKIKTFIIPGIAFVFVNNVAAQNVGIGLPNPLYPLHVAGTIKTNNNLYASGNGWIAGKVTIGDVVPNDEYKLRVLGGKTWTSILTAGGIGFDGKMFSVYGDSKLNGSLELNGAISGITTAYAQNLQLSGDGIVGGNFRVNGRIGINGATNSNFGLIVNNANSYLQGNVQATGDGIIEGNFRTNGRMGINGPTNANYGLIVNNANTYLQGNATISGSATINGNATVSSNTTIGGNLNIQGSTTIQGKGSVRSDGPSSLRIGFSSYYTNMVYDNKEEKAITVNIADFDLGTQNVRVMISQFEPGSGYEEDIRHFTWYVYDCDHVANTCKIRIINQSAFIKVLKGTFHLMAVAKD